MSDKQSGEQPLAVQRFWHNYFSVLEKSSVPARSRPWYRKHVEGYIRAYEGRRLSAHTAQNVDSYLNAKGRLPQLQEWQFRQIADALRILFRNLLATPWAQEYDWYRWRAFARTLEADHVTLMQESSATLSAPSSNPMIARFREIAAPEYAAFVKTLRVRRMAARAEQTYEHWIARFFQFHGQRPFAELGAEDVSAFLEYLALDRQVSSSTQRVALNALVFLFRVVLGKAMEDAVPFTRSRAQRRIPVVLSQAEIRDLLSRMQGRSGLMASLMYGTGMRLMECVRLRVQDIDFGFRQITVRAGKGGKDRVVPLPETLVPRLTAHLVETRIVHNDDLAAGCGEVLLPVALARKCRSAATDWRWQYAFPATRLALDHATGRMRRHHIHQTSLQKAIRKAARDAGIDKRVSSHTLRHSFATHLLHSGKDIRLIQDLLGHADVSTTMIYTHVLQKGGLGVQSPLDVL
jgi:integron integrase